MQTHMTTMVQVPHNQHSQLYGEKVNPLSCPVSICTLESPHEIETQL